MRRRTYLATLSAATVGLAGCDGLTADPTPTATPTPDVETLPSMTVTHRWYGGYSYVAGERVVAERGRLALRLSYRSDGREPCHIEQDLSDDVFGALARLVQRSDPDAWAERYDCEDVCATDDGWEELIVTIDGTEYRTGIDPMRTAPNRIEAVRERMKRLEDRFDPDGACES